MVANGDFENINYGKTGSFEKSLDVVRSCLDSFFTEIDKVSEFDEVLSVEEKFLTTITDLENNPLPIPMK